MTGYSRDPLDIEHTAGRHFVPLGNRLRGDSDSSLAKKTRQPCRAASLLFCSCQSVAHA